ncbi:MAG: hypothetical protein JWR72_1425 [Flavisolibacter sp.]|jgi:hypothetical protein|nr:hypothetical protein [Flavisolibacter sp.]
MIEEINLTGELWPLKYKGVSGQYKTCKRKLKIVMPFFTKILS